MTAGVLKTQGTHLYFANPTSSDAELVKMTCPTGINGLGGARDQIDVTCLDNTDDREFIGGLGNPGQVSVPFNFVPSAASHQTLFDLKESGEVIDWLIAFSDGTAAPTLDVDGSFVPPTLRTSAEFKAFVQDVAIDVATADRVTGTLTLQRSGKVTWNWNGPTPAP